MAYRGTSLTTAAARGGCPNASAPKAQNWLIELRFFSSHALPAVLGGFELPVAARNRQNTGSSL